MTQNSLVKRQLVHAGSAGLFVGGEKHAGGIAGHDGNSTVFELRRRSNDLSLFEREFRNKLADVGKSRCVGEKIRKNHRASFLAPSKPPNLWVIF